MSSNATSSNTISATIPNEREDESTWCINGGKKHDWKRWQSNYTPAAKFKCERKGCGFFKKCWHKCKDKDTTCNGCHVVGHKRW